VSSLAIIAALIAMRITPRPSVPQETPVWRGLTVGLTYAFGFAPIRTILLLLALVSFMGMPYTILMPVFAADVLQGGSNTLGFLSTASGAGALIGVMYLASRTSVLGLGRIIVIATFVFGLGLIGFAISRSFWFSMVMLVLTGLGMKVQMAASNTILQTIVDDDKRGRVMSFYGMAFLGIAPFGSLFAGGLAGVIGAGNTVLIGGVACLLGALVFAVRFAPPPDACPPDLRRNGHRAGDSFGHTVGDGMHAASGRLTVFVERLIIWSLKCIIPPFFP